MSLSTYSSPPHPLTQPPGCCGFINLHPRTSLLLRNRFTRVNSPPPSQGLRIWSFSRDGLWACRWAVRRVNLLFPPLHFFADLLSSLSEAVGERICPPGVQTHFSSRQNLFLLWGLMRALVCRSLPHAGGGSPRQLPHLPSKALIEIPVLFSPPPFSSFSLPPFSSSALALTPTCQQPGQQHRVTPGRPVRVHRKISTQARSGILPSNATLHHPTALHCNAVDPLE